MRRRRRRASGLERVGEAQGNRGVVLEAVKALVEPGLLGPRVALQRRAVGRGGGAGRSDLRAWAALEHDAEVEYQGQTAVDRTPVADAEVGRRLVEIYRSVERAHVLSVVGDAVDNVASPRRLSLERELVPVEHRASHRGRGRCALSP